MHAVTIVDRQLVWAPRPDPVPGDTEILVAVRAAGVNSADLLQRLGFYPPPPGAPEDIPGMELAGEVVAVGAQVRRFAVGDGVMALVGGGAQAELAVSDEQLALPVPEGIGWEAAAGFMETFATAFDALVTQCGLGVGERALVTGAAGGVGTAGVQLAAAAGAHVVASARRPGTHQALLDLGAHDVIEPGAAGAHGPYDVVLELVGGQGIADAVGWLATGGRLVVIGVGAGGRVELDLLTLMHRRGSIHASTLRARPLADRAKVIDRVGARVAPLVAAGTVRVPVAAALPMADATAAYERFAAGGKLGKIVLVTGTDPS